MKKIFFSLAILSMAFTSCTNDDGTNESNEIVGSLVKSIIITETSEDSAELLLEVKTEILMSFKPSGAAS